MLLTTLLDAYLCFGLISVAHLAVVSLGRYLGLTQSGLSRK